MIYAANPKSSGINLIICLKNGIKNLCRTYESEYILF